MEVLLVVVENLWGYRNFFFVIVIATPSWNWQREIPPRQDCVQHFLNTVARRKRVKEGIDPKLGQVRSTVLATLHFVHPRSAKFSTHPPPRDLRLLTYEANGGDYVLQF